MKNLLLSLFFVASSVHIVVGQEKIRIEPIGRISAGRLPLSELIESVEYIPLETNTMCLLGEVTFFKVSKNYLLLRCDPSSLIYLFSRTGKFIAQIGGIGSGHGEYNVPIPFSIDETKLQLLVWNSIQSKMLYYNLNGQFIKALDLPSYHVFAGQHRQFGNYHVMMFNGFGQDEFSYRFFSEEFELLSQRVKPVRYVSRDRSSTVFAGPFSHYIFNGLLHVRDASLNDTIYSITRNLSFTPKYIVDFGRLSFTTQIFENSELFLRTWKDHAWGSSFFESNNYVFISFLYQEQFIYLYYDKDRRQVLKFDSNSGIPNDYDGGPDFFPQYQNEKELIAIKNAYIFEENVNRRHPRGNQVAVNRLKRITTELGTISNSMSEANPVVVIVKLK